MNTTDQDNHDNGSAAVPATDSTAPSTMAAASSPDQIPMSNPVAAKMPFDPFVKPASSVSDARNSFAKRSERKSVLTRMAPRAWVVILAGHFVIYILSLVCFKGGSSTLAEFFSCFGLPAFSSMVVLWLLYIGNESRKEHEAQIQSQMTQISQSLEKVSRIVDSSNVSDRQEEYFSLLINSLNQKMANVTAELRSLRFKEDNEKTVDDTAKLNELKLMLTEDDTAKLNELKLMLLDIMKKLELDNNLLKNLCAIGTDSSMTTVRDNGESDTKEERILTAISNLENTIFELRDDFYRALEDSRR